MLQFLQVVKHRKIMRRFGVMNISRNDVQDMDWQIWVGVCAWIVCSGASTWFLHFSAPSWSMITPQCSTTGLKQCPSCWGGLLVLDYRAHVSCLALMLDPSRALYGLYSKRTLLCIYDNCTGGVPKVRLLVKHLWKVSAKSSFSVREGVF